MSVGNSAEVWRAAGRTLLARTLAEMAYEEMLRPVPEPDRGSDAWRLDLPGAVTYRFTARRGSFGAWRIDEASIGVDGESAWDPVRFFVDAAPAVGLSGPATAEAVRELTATQAADARLRAGALPASDLADLSHTDLEGHGTGHPCMFLNKGRIGFSASDTLSYAPEARRDLRLLWVAVAPELGRFHAIPGLDRGRLLEGELDPATRERFAARLRDRAVGEPGSYVWLPVHPYQWDEVVAPLYAGEIAAGRLVPLGDSPNRYRPLQSVRTLTNFEAPGRHDVKVPLMIRNTLVWRGLSAAQTTCAPQVTAWLREIRKSDGFLRDETRVVLLGEVASVTVQHPVLAEIPDAPYRYHDTLGAIWREPLAAHLEPGERARTMAALLLEGGDGESVAAELVRRSGLATVDWLRAYLHALFPPLLHYLFRYGASFTPHGENVVLIFDADDVPVRIALKDFGADVELLPFDLPEYAGLPEEVRGMLHRWDATELAHSILSAICAGHFRFFVDIVERHLGVPDVDFWALVRAEVIDYQRAHPELAERFGWFDLLAPECDRIALNREQLLAVAPGAGSHDRAERDAEFDVSYGKVANPLHSEEHR